MISINGERIKWVCLFYKTGWKPAIDYRGWDHLMRFVRHKRGPKPRGFMFYTARGLYSMTTEYNYAEMKNKESI